MTHLFLFAGEKSGDLHGGHLLKALKQHLPQSTFTGVGGPEMRKHGIEPVLRMEDFEVMGFSDVFFALPKLWKHFYLVRDHILQNKPKGVILIDYPGFNLRLAKSLRKKGYQGKIVQYISPTVWAYGKKRIDTLSSNMNLLLTIYPFEEKCYEGTSLQVQYVGNPLIEYINAHLYQKKWKDELQIPHHKPILALFPGSRTSEIEKNLHLQMGAMELFFKKYPDRILCISCSSQEHQTIIKKILSSSSLQTNNVFFIPRKFTYELMRDARTAIAKSGTVTLELALHNCPTVVSYKLSPVNRFIAKYILRLNLPHYCIVNILANKEVFPELIEHNLSAQNLFHHLCRLDEQGEPRNHCLAECDRVASMIGIPDASQRAAKAILEAIR